jgi:hypothetical protein
MADVGRDHDTESISDSDGALYVTTLFLHLIVF